MVNAQLACSNICIDEHPPNAKSANFFSLPRRSMLFRELKALARQKMRKIARTLKRTEGATGKKAFSLGVSLTRERKLPH
jgi:hypothetical protein